MNLKKIKNFAVNTLETVLAGSGGSDSYGIQISGSHSNEKSGIRETTSGEVGDGSAFAKSFSPSFDDAE